MWIAGGEVGVDADGELAVGVFAADAVAGFVVLGVRLAADGVARTLLSPSEVPVGVITAICGVPFFLWLLRKKKQMVF